MKAGKKRQHISTISIMIISMVPFTGLAAAQSDAPAPQKRSASAKQTVTAKEVQDLKEAVTAQQQQIRQQNQLVEQLRSQLQQLMDATQQANAAAQKAANGVDAAQTTAAQAQQSAIQAKSAADQAASNAADVKSALAVVDTTTQDQRRQLSALEALVGRFRFSGDVRIRGESYFQSGVPDDNLARIRVRFGNGRPAQPGLHRRFCLGYRQSGESNLHQRNPYQCLRSEDDRIGPRLHHLQSRRA